MSQSSKDLIESVLRSTAEGGKFVFGLEEVLESVKSSKLVVYSSSAPHGNVSRIVEACAAASVPSVAYDGSSLDLGRVCRKPFRVSAVAIKTPGAVDLTPLLGSSGKKQ
ncbi:MAG: ribosomal L7Ae/L30e/S12e/Gadd45 family protein [Thaumarchaeota archaeon]|nr:ribosomal L7Ae/L30e/S12e/Gadd45 family protein [Nitrososphaerota archaeon]